VTAPTIPSSPAELEEFLNDPVKMKSLIGQPKAMADLIDNYSTKVHNKDKDLAQQFKAELEMGLVDFLDQSEIPGPRGRKVNFADVAKARSGRNGLKGAQNKGHFYNSAALGAPLDSEFKDAAEFFQAIWHRNDQLKNFEELKAKKAAHAKIVNAYGSTVPSDGGFLIPEALRSEILTLSLESSIVRSRATVIPMDSLKVPIPAVDETSRVSSIYGGITFYWTAEGGPGVDSSGKFGQVTLDAKKLFGYAGIPNELLHDSAAFLGWFGAKFPQGVGWFEDVAFLTGDGTDKPLGIFNGQGVVSVTRTTSSQIRYEDVVAMYSRMYPSSVQNAVWVCSHDVFPQLAEMYFIPNSGGGGTTPVSVMMWQQNAVGAPVQTLLGRPVIFTEKVPALGSTGDISFIDFSEYLIGDRQMMQIESSSDYLFGTDKTAFRVIERVDGRPWLQTPITPHNGSASTLSPYVTLHA
jgi:HK97 family phage major capsid protein